MTVKERLRALVPARLYTALAARKYALMTRISPAWNSRARWKQKFHTRLDLAAPVLFNEKLMWLKLNCYNKSPFVRRLADKYQVLHYVESLGLGALVKTCFGVWDRPEEIDWDALPERFVLKTTLGCGHHVFCRDKAAFDRAAAADALRRAQRQRDYLQYSELQYRPTRETPNRILCERLLDTGDAGAPNDYKLYCFYGEPRFVLTCFDRAESGKAEYLFTDLAWNRVDYHPSTCADGVIPRPACLDEMIEAARRLSAPFPFVRVDFFEEHGRPVFGELTFTPAGCVDDEYTEKGHRALGELIDLCRVDAGALLRLKQDRRG